MPQQLKADMKRVKLTLLHKGEQIEIECPVIHWQIGSTLDWLPHGGEPVTIKKFINEVKYEYSYLPIFAGFDIETTNIITDKIKQAFMYHWQFALATIEGGYIILGRTWQQFADFCEYIQKQYLLGDVRKLLVWDANLGFEFQFMRHRFEWDSNNFFAREERHPLAAMTTGGIDFHEALSISGGSLAQLAKDFTTTQKLKGDLDYDILRTYKTPLTDQEENYCINDVAILAEWSSFIFDRYIHPDKKIPLTKTGLLRSEIRAELRDILGYTGTKEFKQLVYQMHPDEETYAYWFRWLFRGGYVHSNIVNTGYTIKDGIGVDETSAYPAWMNFGYYPGTPFAACYDIDKIDELINSKCCIITVIYEGLKRKYSISYESKHKCMLLEGSEEFPIIIDNGRIAQCAKTKVVLTELDYKIYEQLYSYKKKTIVALWTADRIKLPPFILNVLNRHYKKKAQMKKAGLSGTPEYSLEKSGINAAYGMMVTRLSLSEVTYTTEWTTKENAINFDKERRKQILAPQWGIWVTAHARMALFLPAFELIKKFGADVIIYNDTDSHKLRNLPGVWEVFETYNAWIKGKIKKCGLNDPEFDDLGCYDLESPDIKRIKCLGAKRYLVEENGHIKATVAGMPKAAILNVQGDPFKKFNIWGMELEADLSLKNTIHYEDNETAWHAPDGCIMTEYSSAAIYPISFKLKLDKFYKQFVEKELQEAGNYEDR